MYVESVSKRKRFTLGQARFDAFTIKLWLLFVVDQNHNDIGRLRRFGRGHNGQPRRLGFGPRFTALVKTDYHVNPAFVQVQRVRVSLTSVADNRDFFTFQVIILQSL